MKVSSCSEESPLFTNDLIQFEWATVRDFTTRLLILKSLSNSAVVVSTLIIILQDLFRCRIKIKNILFRLMGLFSRGLSWWRDLRWDFERDILYFLLEFLEKSFVFDLPFIVFFLFSYDRKNESLTRQKLSLLYVNLWTRFESVCLIVQSAHTTSTSHLVMDMESINDHKPIS